VPHLLWHAAPVFPVSFEGPPQLVASYDTHGDTEDLFYPGITFPFELSLLMNNFL
jgi:hypothetical protein